MTTEPLACRLAAEGDASRRVDRRERGPARRVLVGVVAGLLLTAAVGAQDAAAFDRSFAAFGAQPSEAAATAAANAFLALPDGRERRARVLDGAEALLGAGRTAMAQECLDEARAAGMRNGRFVRLDVRAAFAGQPFARAVAAARVWSQAFPDDVRLALVAMEVQVASSAEKALRAGAVSDARFVFEQLAAAPPLASYRVANLALCLRQVGEVDGARRQYDLARSLAPEDIETENDFGLFLRGQGDVKGAAGAFWRAWELDLQRGEALRARGPAITNLVHLEATRPGAAGGDPLAEAAPALAARPDAVMLRRVALDVALARARR